MYSLSSADIMQPTKACQFYEVAQIEPLFAFNLLVY
jgi:hypothetical protein